MNKMKYHHHPIMIYWIKDHINHLFLVFKFQTIEKVFLYFSFINHPKFISLCWF